MQKLTPWHAHAAARGTRKGTAGTDVQPILWRVARLIAHLSNPPELTACALFPARAGLHWSDPAPPAELAWGMGFVQGEEVLLQKSPRATSSEVDFYGLARPLRADALIARAGAAGAEPGAPENTDPFRFRSWLFGMLGEVGGFVSVRERLLQSIPEFLRRNIRGLSASEHVFHLFLAFLHDGGLLESRALEPATLRHALAQSSLFLDRLLSSAGHAPTPRTLAVTNGRALVVEAGLPAQFLAVDGIADCGCPHCPARREPGSPEPRRIAHPELRMVTVESDPALKPRLGWTPLQVGAALLVGSDHRPIVAASAGG